MDRRKILLGLTTIAALSTIYWAYPPLIRVSFAAGVVCAVWGGVSLLAVVSDTFENMAYRLSSFLGFMFLTVEGCMGLFVLVDKPYLLWVALLHGLAFCLAVMGRWKKVSSQRPRRTLDDALASARAEQAAQNGPPKAE